MKQNFTVGQIVEKVAEVAIARIEETKVEEVTVHDLLVRIEKLERERRELVDILLDYIVMVYPNRHLDPEEDESLKEVRNRLWEIWESPPYDE